MQFSIKNFFSKCDQIRRKLRIWSHSLKKSLMQNFIFGALLLPYGIGLSEDYLKTSDFILLCATNANERNGGRQYVLPTDSLIYLESNWRKTICPKKLNLFYNHRKVQSAHTITKVSASLVSIRNYPYRKISM